jgi:DNA-binding response OmpR family regulator
MPRALIQTSRDAAAVESALREAGFETLTASTENTPDDPAETLVREAAAHQPDLIVADLVTDDAVSVKAMQRVSGTDPFVKFLFLTPPDVDLAHAVMAMNEGAAALLASPADPGALGHYAKRAVKKGEYERKGDEEVRRFQRQVEKEKSCSLEQAQEITDLKRRLTSAYRLINHLTAVADVKPKPKVLLVSDSAYQVDRFRKALESHNFDVVTAGDGEEGLEKARTHKPRIVVSDLEMPKKNGLELCRDVKNDETLIPNHFIIATANADKINAVMTPENKVDDCLVKPSREEDFQEFVARVAMGLIQ